MRVAALVVAALSTGLVLAKLPPPTEEAKAKAAEAAAKSAWTGKVDAYKTCLAQDRAVANYRKTRAAAGQNVPAPANAQPCSDPGPFRPLEASGAHSPPETNAGPPSSPIPQAGKK